MDEQFGIVPKFQNRRFHPARKTEPQKQRDRRTTVANACLSPLGDRSELLCRLSVRWLAVTFAAGLAVTMAVVPTSTSRASLSASSPSRDSSARCPWMNTSLSSSARAHLLLGAMSLADKFQMVHGGSSNTDSQGRSRIRAVKSEALYP